MTSIHQWLYSSSHCQHIIPFVWNASIIDNYIKYNLYNVEISHDLGIFVSSEHALPTI